MKVAVIVIAAVAAFCTALMILLWSRTVTIVVPDGYRGLVRIDRVDGATGPRIGWFELVIEVPASGSVALPSLKFFRRFHRTRARYASGAELPVSLTLRRLEGVALQTMYAPARESIYYYVGTASELHDFVKANERKLYSVP
jgi:hypothetical protein